MTMKGSPEEQEALERHRNNREAIRIRYQPEGHSGQLDYPEYEQALRKETNRFMAELKRIKKKGN